MALNIDKKVYRNLQEQVSWLTTTVGEIIDVTNPAAIKEAIEKVDTFEEEMSGYADTMGGYATTMEGYALQVDTWTNNIATAAVQAISGQDITPKTVFQSQTNWGGDITVTSRVPSGLSLENLYSKVQIIGNKLSIIMHVKVTNTTASAISITQDNTIAECLKSIPDQYKPMIYDMNNNPMNYSYGSDILVLITSSPLLMATSISGPASTIPFSYAKEVGNLSAYARNAQGRMQIYLQPNQNISFPASASRWFIARVTLNLI